MRRRPRHYRKRLGTTDDASAGERISAQPLRPIRLADACDVADAESGERA